MFFLQRKHLDKSKFRLSAFVSKNDNTHKVKICHPERSVAESKDLRILLTFAVNSVRRSFGSLRSLRMTAALVSFWLYVLTAWLSKPDSLNRNLKQSQSSAIRMRTSSARVRNELAAGPYRPINRNLTQGWNGYSRAWENGGQFWKMRYNG